MSLTDSFSQIKYVYTNPLIRNGCVMYQNRYEFAVLYKSKGVIICDVICVTCTDQSYYFI